MIADVVRIGRLPIDKVTFEQALSQVDELVSSRRGGTVFTPNVDHIVMAEEDAALREAYEAASLRLVDGMPVVWASRALGKGLPEKISGSDFVPRLLEHARDQEWRVYLLGSTPDNVASAAARLLTGGVNVVGYAGPRIDVGARHDDVLEAVSRTTPDIVLLGLGAPKQELFAHQVASRLAPAVLLGVGATIDFLAGALPRAPSWMSRSGLEWLYRLGREPTRLWRRYLLRDPKFAWIVMRQLGVG
jgi:N-acetylglucosaminyldiphosphoundecaprenol N-acetyl-beta-D-mannosaminyltransferase